MSRWVLKKNSGIRWNTSEDKDIPHIDHLEMSGKEVSMYVEYGVLANGELTLSQTIVVPKLRTIPNNTHASLMVPIEKQLFPVILVGSEILSEEKPTYIEFNGILTINSNTKQKIEVKRTLFPSKDKAVTVEIITLKNVSESPVTVSVKEINDSITKRGCYGLYIIDISIDKVDSVLLDVGKEISFSVIVGGRKLINPVVRVNADEERLKREQFIDEVKSSIKLHTPDDVINQAFEFAKIRASESVFDTKSGLLHSPGGLSYYAAVWTNDQAEYVGPFFPFLGDKDAVEASLNAYKLFMPFMGKEYLPIPSSIISEAMDIWEGAGDRGDAAMYAYGASRFALALGDVTVAQELWCAIEWCLEYCNRQMTSDGVIASDSDELEGRFSTGKANLSTSSLTYGGLKSAANLARSLGKYTIASEYEDRSEKLRKSIENYFGANIEGYDTYRYHEGNDVLRSWICLPLTMGIMDRKDETIKALFSPKLWTQDGVATQSGEKTFWDRSTLYGFRGVFSAGESEQALFYLKQYSRRRVLGEHVPYPVEAYPEGNQRHLSAESALYCRIFTEGLFGITPIGLGSFSLKPNMPDEWTKMSLTNVKAFADDFNITIKQTDADYEIIIYKVVGQEEVKYTCKKGETIVINLK